MGDTLISALALAVVAGVYLLAMVFAGRLRGGRFRVHEGPNRATITTDVGRFALSPTAGFEVAGRLGPIPLEGIRGLRYRYSSATGLVVPDALGPEAALSARPHRDHVDWYEIAVVTDADVVPVYVVGQLERREAVFAWWHRRLFRVLQRLHLINDAEAEARRVLEQLLETFRWAGKTLPLL